MFMELYLEPLTERDKADLRTIFSYVPGSERALEKMLRLDDCADDKHDSEIIDLVRSDLNEMRRIVNSEPVLKVISSGEIEFMLDEARFEEVRRSDLNWQYQTAMGDYLRREKGDYLRREKSGHNAKIEALREAFYGLASDLHLQKALTADLLGVDVSFDNYFELYLIGVHYALDSDRVLVMNFRKLYENNRT